MKQLSVLCLGVLLFFVSGCELRHAKAKPVKFSYYTAANTQQFQRIGIIPFYYADKVGKSAEIIDKTMTAAIRELGAFEVSIISEKMRDELFGADVIALSAIDPYKLREIRQRTHVDAIIIGRVEQYDGYDPISIGIECHMVSCTDAQTMWSASAHFDSRRRDVQDDIKRWYRYAVGKGNEAIGGWELTLHTPELFCRYVSDRLAASVLH